METLRYIVLVNGLLAIVSVAYYVLLRRETFFGANRLALWLGLSSALILPLLELPDWRPQPVRTAMQRTARVIIPKVLPNSPTLQPEVNITFPNGQMLPAFPRQHGTVGWSWQAGLIILYIAGVFILLIRFGIQLASVRKVISQSVHEPYEDFTLVWDKHATSPFSFFGWVVVNPNQHEPDELEQILRHERVHVRERHSFDMIGAELVCIIFWINPAAYVFRHLVHQTLEFSADRAVLAEGVDVKAYQYNLLKVSLSSGQSIITNHFSKSQLISRIAMLNQQESSKVTWLKYPVFFITALTVASAFALPQPIRALHRYVPKPVAETIAAMAEPAKDPFQPVEKAEQITGHKPLKSRIGRSSIGKQRPQELESQTVPVLAPLVKDPARISPSRYMVYQGDYLYWIVTPKITFDDFAVIKQELAKYGYQLQLNEVKYDPLYVYIEHIVLSTVGPTGVQAKINEVDDDNKPIPTNAGYITTKYTKDYEVWSSRLNGRFSKTFPLYQTTGEENFPDILRKVAADDEAAVSRFMNERKMEYLVVEGERKYGHLGIGFRKFSKEAIKKESSRGGFVKVNPDGSLSIQEGSGSWTVKAFVNNEPSTLEEVQKVTINQLYTLAVVLGYDNSTQKRSGADYLFFYVNEAN